MKFLDCDRQENSRVLQMRGGLLGQEKNLFKIAKKY